MTRLLERVSDRMLSFVVPEAAADAGCVYINTCEDRCAAARWARVHYKRCGGSGWEYMYREACGSC
jgi:hypothetical protein